MQMAGLCLAGPVTLVLALPLKSIKSIPVAHLDVQSRVPANPRRQNTPCLRRPHRPHRLHRQPLGGSGCGILEPNNLLWRAGHVKSKGTDVPIFKPRQTAVVAAHGHTSSSGRQMTDPMMYPFPGCMLSVFGKTFRSPLSGLIFIGCISLQCAQSKGRKREGKGSKSVKLPGRCGQLVLGREEKYQCMSDQSGHQACRN